MYVLPSNYTCILFLHPCQVKKFNCATCQNPEINNYWKNGKNVDKI